jgi:glycine/D-amino acid oxidase-like deaminating enzyme
MLKLTYSAPLLALIVGCVGPESDPTDTDDTPSDLRCEVAIVGGGAGGLHTAFRLAADAGMGENVCLFELEDRLGGRIKDLALDETDPNSPRVGVGARRIAAGQVVVERLASELELVLDTPARPGSLINVEGGSSYNSDDLVPLYSPDLTCASESDGGTATEDCLLDLLLEDGNRSRAADFELFGDYVVDVTGEEGWQFLRDMSRFRGDYQADIDPVSYLDWLTEELTLGALPSYPHGGMSSFIEGMASRTADAGGQIFLSEPVARIDRDGDGFSLQTATMSVSATSVVIAVPPIALEWIEGDVIDDIKAQPEVSEIQAIEVVNVTNWWPSPWWEEIRDSESDEGLWRAWTTESCVNFIEIPQEEYLAEAWVTRSVYNDDSDCADFWLQTLEDGGEEAVNAAVIEGLEQVFSNNGYTLPETVTLPEPVKTQVQVWPDAWHWLGAGATTTNTGLRDWAVEPLPGESVGLVGEAYNVQRSAWSDAAYKSSIYLLNSQYGMDLSTD